MTKKEIEDNYAISRRIEAEERALETATMVLTSTQQEIDEQWGLYDGCTPFLPSSRCLGSCQKVLPTRHASKLARRVF